MYHSTSSASTTCEELSGFKARTFRDWVAHKYTKSDGRLQMRTKRPLRGPVREEAGPTLKNYITPTGLQRLKDEHRFLLSRERPAVVEVVAWLLVTGTQ